MKRNYRRNLAMQAPKLGKMICGQALGEVSKLRYGICPMSFNGCEVIAVCNALSHMGKPVDIRETAAYMESFRVLLGFFGCNVFRIGRALEHFGIENKTVSPDEAGDVFIMSSWTGRAFLSSVHTVFCVRENGRIKVFNRYNSCKDVKIYDDISDIFKGRKIIVIYNVLEIKN